MYSSNRSLFLSLTYFVDNREQLSSTQWVTIALFHSVWNSFLFLSVLSRYPFAAKILLCHLCISCRPLLLFGLSFCFLCFGLFCRKQHKYTRLKDSYLEQLRLAKDQRLDKCLTNKHTGHFLSDLLFQIKCTARCGFTRSWGWICWECYSIPSCASHAKVYSLYSRKRTPCYFNTWKQCTCVYIFLN